MGIKSLLKPTRSLVKEGLGYVYPRRTNSAFNEVHCLLFNDVLLLFNRSKRRLQSIFLKGACVSLESHQTISGLLVYGLIITRSSESLAFFLHDAKEIQVWQDSIKRLIRLRNDKNIP